MKKNTLFPIDEVVKEDIINVASVPQRSPFRYPGGKTWLIPVVRDWLGDYGVSKATLVEPFAGGGIVSLTAAFENLVQNVIMVEKDEEVAAVWEVIINGECEWLANKIINFQLTHESLERELNKPRKSLKDIAFCTILKNRTFHGGILARGSGLLKHGENGKGIHSRWYPVTLHKRIMAINVVRQKINFVSGDAFDIIKSNKNKKNICYFIDPPYTVAGKRLYTYFEIDHEKLFKLVAEIKGRYMLTYDDSPYIRGLLEKYKLSYKVIPMKTTLHFAKNELIICDEFNWWRG